MHRTKASLWVLAATAATVATLFLLPYTPRVAVRTAPVERGDLVATLRMEGAVSHAQNQPCVALQGGRVSGVYVRQGEAVRRGQLLFCLDSRAEEQALAALAKVAHARDDQSKTLLSEAVVAVTAQGALETATQAAELRARIELKRVRADFDGVMGGVYVREGDYVAEAGALGLVSGAGVGVSALCRATDASGLSAGAPAMLFDASGNALGLATLTGAGAPMMNDASGLYLQTLTLEPSDPQALAGMRAGDAVTVELLVDAMRDVPLIPLSAVDADDTLWISDGGRAMPVKVDASQRNADYVRVPDELLGCQAILCPDEHALHAGCPVKEAKKR